MKDVVIRCETEGCSNKGKAVNEVELPECDLALFMWSFGQGGEEEADYCPECGKLGIAHDSPPTCSCVSDNTTFVCPQCRQILCQDCEDVHICEPD